MAKELVYDFYEPPYTTNYYPINGPTTGSNFQRHQGFGFMLGRPHLNDRLWVRLLNFDSKAPVTEEIEIPQDSLNIDEWTWLMPPVNVSQEVMIQISLNQQDWTDVLNLESGKSYFYQQAAHVTSLTPSFGHVKPSK